ncbi:MAG TPA: DUF4190 domain-containing protein [Verrucomicrobiae bacterium]|jgi:Domain of unknown function (DUF4190)|nr:DUF4190 domain-containing protein [Verrucomicrobiae bacterium]
MVLPPRRTSGLAIGSLICAIFGWGPGSIAAVILGHVALRQIRRDPLRVKGKGVAKAGIVLGWVGIVALTVMIWLGVHFRKMFEEHPQRPQAREVHLITAGLVGHRGISPPHALMGGQSASVAAALRW